MPPMTAEDFINIQRRLELSDGRIAKALGVTRQTWRNWRCGRPCPRAMQHYLAVLLELRRLDPSNDNLPPPLRFKP